MKFFDMTRHVFGRLGGLLAALAATAPSALAQEPASATQDTAYIAHVATQARQASDRLSEGQRPDQRADNQYREAVAEMERGNFNDAALTLQAALQRSRNNAKYRGDFAYVLARQNNWSEAHAAYVQAYQHSQQRNPWYLVGAALSKANQRAWADAAGTVALATQADSSIVDGRLASMAAGWFEQAGDAAQSLAWSRIAVRRDSNDLRSWLRIAMRTRNDTTSNESITATRRARALNPDDKLGNALYADWLYRNNQIDSAIHYAGVAAQDSSYREFAADIFLQAGRTALQQRDHARVRRVLGAGMPWANAAQRPGYNNLLGRAELLYATALLQGLETSPNCDSARIADTLLVQAQGHLEAGVAFDSARTTMILSQVMPNYRQQSATQVRQACAARPARPGNQPRRRP